MTSSGSTLTIVPLLIAAVFLIGLAVGITLWIRGARATGGNEMSCGGCGYAVRGLESLHCPECGADLRKVGINRPKSGTTRGLGIALTIGTLLLMLTCVGAIFFSDTTGPPSPAVNTIQNPTNQSASPSLPTAPPHLSLPEQGPTPIGDTDGASTEPNDPK